VVGWRRSISTSEIARTIKNEQMGYGLSCQCEDMVASCEIPGNEIYLGLLCATILAMLVMCRGEEEDEEEDKPPGGMYN